MVIALAIVKVMLAATLYFSSETLTKIKTQGYKTHLVTFLWLISLVLVPLLCVDAFPEIIGYFFKLRQPQKEANSMVIASAIVKVMLAATLEFSVKTLTKIKTQGYKTHLVTFLWLISLVLVPLLYMDAIFEIVGYFLMLSQPQNCIFQDCTLQETFVKGITPMLSTITPFTLNP